MAEGARLEIAYVVKAASRVQIPPSPSRKGPLTGPFPVGTGETSAQTARFRHVASCFAWPLALPFPFPFPPVVRSAQRSAAASMRVTAAARAESFFIRAISETHLPNAFDLFLFVP